MNAPNQNLLITRQIDAVSIPQRASDGFVNATALCKAAGKLIGNYFRNETTSEFLKELSTSMRISIDLLVVTATRGRNEERGTWVHPRVAANLGQWCSPRFAVLVSEWVTDWIERKSVPSTRPSISVPETLEDALILALGLEREKKALKAKLVAAAPAIALHDAVAASKGSMLISDFAKILGLNPNLFFEMLRSDGILFKRKKKSPNLPKQEHLDAGRFEVDYEAYKDADGEEQFRAQTKVTPIGQIWLAPRYSKAQPPQGQTGELGL